MKRKGKAWEACVQSHAFMARENTHGIAVQDNALSALQKKAYLKASHPHNRTRSASNR